MYDFSPNVKKKMAQKIIPHSDTCPGLHENLLKFVNIAPKPKE